MPAATPASGNRSAAYTIHEEMPRLRERQAPRGFGVAASVATVFALACAAALTLSTSAGGRPLGGTCPDHALTQPPGSFVSQPVTVPPSYDGDMFRPGDTQTYPGKRPAVALMHGKGGTKCSLAWAARLLAAHGYVTLILTNPGTGSQPDPVPGHILATRQAVKYLRSSSNPFDQYIQDKNIGLAGHSLGAKAVSFAQGVALNVQAIVALDNLNEFSYGDPATPLNCSGNLSHPATPRVPALGMAMDLPCASDPPKTDKQYGYKAWHSAKLPAMELVMRGFAHTDFGGGATDAKLKRAGYYMLAWFNRWLLHDQSQCAKLLSAHPLGISIGQMLSARQMLVGHPSKAFHSAAYLPGKVDSDDLVAYLQNHQQIC